MMATSPTWLAWWRSVTAAPRAPARPEGGDPGDPRDENQLCGARRAHHRTTGSGSTGVQAGGGGSGGGAGSTAYRTPITMRAAGVPAPSLKPGATPALTFQRGATARWPASSSSSDVPARDANGPPAIALAR